MIFKMYLVQVIMHNISYVIIKLSYITPESRRILLFRDNMIQGYILHYASFADMTNMIRYLRITHYPNQIGLNNIITKVIDHHLEPNAP